MPKQLAQERKYNFQEVALGYSHDQAKAEAERCLQCKRPKCVEGCPVGVDIPKFIQALKSGEMSQAVVALKAKNNLPGICGRVCPQEVPLTTAIAQLNRDTTRYFALRWLGR